MPLHAYREPRFSLFEGDLPESVAEALLASPIVAVDTETSGLDWSADRLQLCQLFEPTVGTVLLRPGPDAPRQLARILGSDQTVKVFHFAPFDLRFLRSTWDVTVRNVRCTKTAHKLLHPAADSREHSLAVLLKQYLGVQLDKGAVRVSDWGAPNLSSAQIAYASGDVLYLIPLLERLEAELASAGLAHLFDAVCHYLPTGTQLEVGGYPDPFQY